MDEIGECSQWSQNQPLEDTLGIGGGVEFLFVTWLGRAQLQFSGEGPPLLTS